MPQATITIAYVNPPKTPGWSGSVKTSLGKFYGVKEAMLPKFERGKTYTVEYQHNQARDGRTFNDITSVVTTPDAPMPFKPAPTPNHYVPANPQERGMFIMGVVGRAMGSGKYQIADIRTLAMEAAQTYDEVFLGKFADDTSGEPWETVINEAAQ